MACLELAKHVPQESSVLESVLRLMLRELVNDPVSRDQVDCTAFSPPKVARGRSILVQVFLHRPEHTRRAAAAARKADPSSSKCAFQSLNISLRRGDRVNVNLKAEGLDVEDSTQSVVWSGKPESVQFLVKAGSRAKLGEAKLKVTLIRGGVPIGMIQFTIKVTRSASRKYTAEPVGRTATTFRTLFPSYAWEDRIRVIDYLDTIDVSGIKIFTKALVLNPEERWSKGHYTYIDDCDLFFLFWSASAKKSDGVRREAFRAHSRKKGVDENPPQIWPCLLDLSAEPLWDEFSGFDLRLDKEPTNDTQCNQQAVAVDLGALVSFLSRLAPSRWAAYLASIHGATPHISDDRTVAQQVAQLIRLTEDPEGPTLAQLWHRAEEVFPAFRQARRI